MQFLKRTIDPFYLILCFGVILCMILSFVTMSYIGELEEKMNRISSDVEKIQNSESSTTSSQKTVNEEVEEIVINADTISINAENVSVKSEGDIVIENNSNTPVIYYDQGLFVPSGLSADQFNDVITKALVYYNREPEGYLAYNLGATFEEIERTYGINSLYLIGITQRESGFNSSDNAKATNNLTSIMSGTSLKYYSSIEENLLDTARLLRNVYCNKWGLGNIYDVGKTYNPVNDSWASKVQESVNLFYSLINTPES